MILNNDQTIKKIKSDQACLADIWENFTNKTDEVNRFHRIVTDNTDALLDYLTAFMVDFPGKYTIIARKEQNQGLNMGTKFNVEFVAPLPNAFKPILPVNGLDPSKPHYPASQQPQMSMPEIMAQAMQIARGELANQFQSQFFQTQVLQYKEENERLKQPAYKLAFLAEQLLAKMVINPMQTQTTPPMNGNNQNPNPSQGGGNVSRYFNSNGQQQQQQQPQNQQPQNQQQQTPPNFDDPARTPGENALVFIAYTFGEQNLVKFAYKMRNDSGFNAMVTNMINSIQN